MNLQLGMKLIMRSGIKISEIKIKQKKLQELSYNL